MERGVAGRRVGVRDVAVLAGVSTQTVSRVLNGSSGVREDTRVRVLSAVRALDYRINNAARSLGTNRTRTVGILASDPELFGPSVGLAALEAAARSQSLWTATAYADADDPVSTRAAVAHLIGLGVDGIIVVSPHGDSFRSLIDSQPGLPVIALHDERQQRAASHLLVEFLADHGHRRIVELAGPRNWMESEGRSAGLHAAATRRGVVIVERMTGDWSAATGASVANRIDRLLSDPLPPTAVVVANDQMALGLISGLMGLGKAVPRDVSVVGVDDNPDSAYYIPALTTVRMDVDGDARTAIAAVVGQPSPPRASPTLVVRASTAPSP